MSTSHPLRLSFRCILLFKQLARNGLIACGSKATRKLGSFASADGEASRSLSSGTYCTNPVQAESATKRPLARHEGHLSTIAMISDGAIAVSKAFNTWK